MTLVFATNNAHKVQEAAAVLGGGICLKTLLQCGIDADIPETHDTLEGNARQKAQYIYSLLRANCFADDTGLEVDAIHGAPGVHSARYAGEFRDMAANKQKLLGELKGIAMRTARFRTVISLIFEYQEYLFEGIIEGIIAEEERGAGGFGYDGLFIPNGCVETFAQMSAQQKNAFSHRARALQKMKEFLFSGQVI